MHVEIVPVLKDNYVYIVYNDNKEAFIIDPAGDVLPIYKAVERLGLKIRFICNTHHHWDHVGGNLAVKKYFNVPIYVSSFDFSRIEGADMMLGEDLDFCGQNIRVMNVPGHTRGHVALFIPGCNLLFCGDVLFSGGCGRLLEGSADEMYDSISSILSLPDDTLIYCSHEYTLANLIFALSVDKNNMQLQSYYDRVCKMRNSGVPTVPCLLSEERLINPFLRCNDAIFRNVVCGGIEDPVAAFKYLRGLKDNFTV